MSEPLPMVWLAGWPPGAGVVGDGLVAPPPELFFIEQMTNRGSVIRDDGVVAGGPTALATPSRRDNGSYLEWAGHGLLLEGERRHLGGK